jgi:mannonate dehydratase
MTIQDQLPWDQVTDENLAFFKAIGVDYLTIYPPPDLRSLGDGSDYWRRTRDLVESHGLKWRNVALSCPDAITLGLSDRDETIASWRAMMRGMGEAGVPTLGTNFKPVGNFRTASEPPGRGGARYSTFDHEELMRDPPDFPEKRIGEDRLWENLAYFLREIVPVAEEAGVRIAFHPDDPPIPEPLGGAARILSTLEQFERLFALASSDAVGMLFCQGCVAEMGLDVPEAIRRIGAQEKIVYVHFRNIRGHPRKFQEVFLDEGDVDMLRAMQTYREIGFYGPFMMDHTPEIPHPSGSWAGRAYANGYIRALIQTVYR